MRTTQDKISQLAFVSGEMLGLLSCTEEDSEFWDYFVQREFFEEDRKTLVAVLKDLASAFYRETYPGHSQKKQ